MKKLALVAAMTATLSSGVQAVPVESDVTDVGLWLGANQLVGSVNGDSGQGQIGTHTDIKIGGDTVTGLTFTGSMAFDVAPASIKIFFDLKQGIRQGDNGAGGTIFELGTILVLQQAVAGVGEFLPFGEPIDAALEGGLSFESGNHGSINVRNPADTFGGCDGTQFEQCTAGLIVADDGTTTFAGLYDGQVFSEHWNDATSALTLLGNTAGIWFEGEVTMIQVAAVPVPAAAWLFGSALVGMAGLRHKRKKS